MKSFAIKLPSFGAKMKSPKVGFSKGKLKMPMATKAPMESGTRAAKGYGAEAHAPGLEPLQPMHTSAHH